MHLVLRRSGDRFHTDAGWLDSRHTFSFGGHWDPEHQGFRTLLVINDDRVAGGGGFPTHGHRDMEIVSYVLEGELAHRDSMGNGSVIRPGDVQRMSAGTGVHHSEMNPSRDRPVRFLQIWIQPDRRGLVPSYEQTHFPPEDRRGRLRLVASRDGREGSVTIHQDAAIHAAILGRGERVEHRVAPGRHAWIQVARGAARLDGTALEEGDGARTSDAGTLAIGGTAPETELLLFDLA